MSRRLEDLDPRLLEKFAYFAMEMAKAKIPFIVTSTLRTYAEQEALYAQGRKPLVIVNALRRAVGWAPLSNSGNRRRVTWTMKSRHLPKVPSNKSIAFDIAILKTPSSVCWDPKADIDADGVPEYEEAGRIGEKCGLIWGGRWSKPDYPHFELKLEE